MVPLKQLFTKRSDELLRSTVALVTGPIIRSRKIVWSLEYRPLLQAANSSCKMEAFFGSIDPEDESNHLHISQDRNGFLRVPLKKRFITMYMSTYKLSETVLYS